MNIKRLIAVIVFVILIIALIPMPFNEKQKKYDPVGYSNGKSTWNFVTVQEGQGMYAGYPKCTSKASSISVITVPDSLSYIEKTFVVPKRGTVFAIFAYTRQHIQLIDYKGSMHTIAPLPLKNPDSRIITNDDKITKYDISPYVGQKVTIRISQYPSSRGYKTWRSNGFFIINKSYTLWDNFDLFIGMLGSALLVSLLIGAIVGVLGSEFFSRHVNKVQTYIHKNRNNGMGFENKYIRRFLKMSFHVLDVSICAADKIGDVRLRTWIKITSVLFLSFTIIYITYIVTYIVVTMVLALVMVAIVIWIIISVLGGSPSGGSIGGSGSGGGGGKDYTTKYGKTYDSETDERVVKQDGKTYRRGSIFELDAGWHADKGWSGDDKVERDWDGSPKIRRDVTGKQIIEGDSSGDPIIEPESEQDK